jgi:hypothetical protein
MSLIFTYNSFFNHLLIKKSWLIKNWTPWFFLLHPRATRKKMSRKLIALILNTIKWWKYFMKKNKKFFIIKISCIFFIGKYRVQIYSPVLLFFNSSLLYLNNIYPFYSIISLDNFFLMPIEKKLNTKWLTLL